MNAHPAVHQSCLILLMALFLSGCQSAEERAKRQQEAQDRQDVVKVDREIAEDSTRFGAVTDWPSLLRDGMFTIDIEPIFVRPDHKPLIFIANLEDVRRSNNQTLLYFRTTPTAKEPVSRLILDCAECNVDSLRTSNSDIGDFEVIADIASATKSLDISEDAPTFVLQGRFIQARWVGDYAVNKGKN